MQKTISTINEMHPLDGTKYEWLETNRKGGFCCGTANDSLSRKYHGLLVTPLNGKEGRFHIFSALEASVHNDRNFILATNFYPGAVFPEGYKNIKDFSPLPFPTWNYQKGKINIKKEVFMLRGEKAVYIAITQTSGPDKLRLDLKPLFTCRPADCETRFNKDIFTGVKQLKNGFEISPYFGLPPVMVEFSDSFKLTENWFWDYNIEYNKDRERGLAFTEDRFVPGIVSIGLEKNRPFIIRVSIEELPKKTKDILESYKTKLKNEKARTAGLKNNLDMLKHFSDNFLVENSLNQKSINAGFPWFGEWGRDTMIALPGLSFCNGKTKWAVDVLCSYASLIKDGLLPNTLGESQGFTSYNSLDAGLLYCRAVLKLIEDGYGTKKTETSILNETLLPAVDSIVRAFIEQRVPNARLTKDKLIEAGNSETQLTWMDATAYGKPVTPRHGLAVDINALWFDSLCVLEKLYAVCKKECPKDIVSIKKEIAKNFKKAFLIKDLGYLSDTVVNGCQDRKLRPNMLFAASAQEGLLTKEERLAVVRAAKEKLLTPAGLRTLSPDDSEFAPVYQGSPDERDSQYHQGTVWPWLIGIMVESSLLATNNVEKETKFWANYLEILLNRYLFKDGLGYVSEIYDGLNPSNGKGCFAQAWSTGEIIRACYLIEKWKTKKRKINE